MRHLRLLFTCAALLAALAPPASAEIVGDFNTEPDTGGVNTQRSQIVLRGPGLPFTMSGRIRRWGTHVALNSAPSADVRLVILRPSAGNSWVAVAATPWETVTRSRGTPPMDADLRVRVGDTIGVEHRNGGYLTGIRDGTPNDWLVGHTSSSLAVGTGTAYTVVGGPAHPLLWADIEEKKAKTLRVEAPATGTAGVGRSVTLTARTANGSVDTGYMGTVHLWTTDPRAPQQYVTFVDADDGTKTVDVELRTAGVQTIHASEPDDPVVAGSTTVSVSPAAASRLALSAPGTARAGVPASVGVTAYDAFDNVASLTDTLVPSFDTGSGPGTLPATAALAGGQGSVPVTFTRVGAQRVAVRTSSGALTALSAPIEVEAGPAKALALALPTDPVVAGEPFEVGVELRDAFGNVVTDDGPAVSLGTAAPNANLPGPVATPDGAGSAAVTLRRAGTTTITASGPGLDAASGTVTVVAGAAAELRIDGAPPGMQAGVPFVLDVSVRDAFGNVREADAGAVQITSSDPDAVLPAPVAAAGGRATVPAQLRVAGRQTLTVTRAGLAPVSTAVDVAAGPLSALWLTEDLPAAPALNAAYRVTVSARDAFGNRVRSFAGPVTFSSAQVGAPPAPLLLRDGQGTATVRFSAPGAGALQAHALGADSGSTAVLAVGATGGAVPSCVMPSLRGLTGAEAQAKLVRACLGVRIVLDGPASSGGTRTEVRRQSIAVGTPIARGQTITLALRAPV